MAAGNSTFIPQFPQPPAQYSQRDQDELRSLIRTALLDIQRSQAGLSGDGFLTSVMTSFYNHGTSTTLADTGLEIEITETGWYSLEAYIQTFADAVADTKLRIEHSSTASGSFLTSQNSSASLRTGEGADFTVAGAAAERGMEIIGYLDITATGTLKVQAAAANAGGSYCIIPQGSWMRVRKLADT